jgi:hypothetical protein
VQLPKIALIEKPADHVRGDHLGADRVKLVSKRELELSISAGQRRLETSVEKAAGLDHDRAGSAAVRVAVGDLEEFRPFRLLGHAAVSAGR